MRTAAVTKVGTVKFYTPPPQSQANGTPVKHTLAYSVKVQLEKVAKSAKGTLHVAIAVDGGKPYTFNLPYAGGKLPNTKQCKKWAEEHVPRLLPKHADRIKIY